jgi:hypothetical protein
VSSLLCILAHLLQGKSPWILLDRGLGGPQTRYKPSEEKSLASEGSRERIPGSPALGLVTILMNSLDVTNEMQLFGLFIIITALHVPKCCILLVTLRNSYVMMRGPINTKSTILSKQPQVLHYQ